MAVEAPRLVASHEPYQSEAKLADFSEASATSAKIVVTERVSYKEGAMEGVYTYKDGLVRQALHAAYSDW